MAINIYENPIQPIIDLDSDVIVYVPGYANYGPSEPTFVTSATFTSVFGSTPYFFNSGQVSRFTPKNNRQATQAEKSWLYAKALTDAGLTVLYHRYRPGRALTAKKEVVGGGAFAIRDNIGNIAGKTFNARAKYFGSAYHEMYVTFTHWGAGIVVVSIYNVEKGTKIEERIVSFNPNNNNYIGNIEFTNIVFYTGEYGEGELTYLDGFESLNLEDYYSKHPGAKLYSESDATLEGAFVNIPIYTLDETGIYVGVKVGEEWIYTEIDYGVNTYTKTDGVYDLSAVGTWIKYGLGETDYAEIITTGTEGTEANVYLKSFIYDEFLVTDLEDELASGSGMVTAVLDTNKYATVTYLTSGGYFQNDVIAGKMMSIAGKIKALAPIDLAESIATVGDVTALQLKILGISTDSDLDKSFGYMDIGADTYVPNGIRTILPDSFGGLMALAGNIRRGIPAWLPVANNTQGMISSAVATTRPVGRTSQEAMITEAGCSINPIVQKQNVGFVLMGNRTLYPNAEGLGPQSFKNCRFVVNSVERAARRVAESLLIASTNATSTFRRFVSGVETTIKKMLVNGDGINSYSIIKLPKTKPATIDVAINLVVVEGIETFNIHIPYSINMQA